MKKRTLNLLPPSKARPLIKKKAVVMAVSAVALYAFLIGGLWLLNGYELDRLNSTIGEMNGRKLELAQLISGVPAPQADQGDAARAEIMKAMRGTPPWEAILSELSMVVPNTIWLEVIEAADTKHMRLKGYSRTQGDIAKLISSLERSNYFGNVEIVYSQKGDTATSFELRVEMTWA
jgi:Tfp pilus assembly protein PilN